MSTTTARQLRKRQTNTEARLWTRLRGHQLDGHKFRRQAPIGPYIADFACFAKRLVVEVGGGQHAIEAGRDQMRDQWLCGQGFLVLRFWNTEVLDNIDGVVERIRETLAEIEGRNDR